MILLFKIDDVASKAAFSPAGGNHRYWKGNEVDFYLLCIAQSLLELAAFYVCKSFHSTKGE